MDDFFKGFAGSVPLALIFGWLTSLIFKRVEKLFDGSTDHEIRLRILESKLKDK